MTTLPALALPKTHRTAPPAKKTVQFGFTRKPLSKDEAAKYQTHFFSPTTKQGAIAAVLVSLIPIGILSLVALFNTGSGKQASSEAQPQAPVVSDQK